MPNTFWFEGSCNGNCTCPPWHVAIQALVWQHLHLHVRVLWHDICTWKSLNVYICTSESFDIYICTWESFDNFFCSVQLLAFGKVSRPLWTLAGKLHLSCPHSTKTTNFFHVLRGIETTFLGRNLSPKCSENWTEDIICLTGRAFLWSNCTLAESGFKRMFPICFAASYLYYNGGWTTFIQTIR